MRIRKLELHGFKSFPDRTVLTFDPGISCIVGPNGCGKSNIVDALRWCIGEQSARSLRGEDMMDVIFAGSQIRKPVGFAEVSMTMSAEGGEPFPGEYAQLLEVSVGRRLHRTGAAEYFINQRRVRRRDIVDFFLDTGVGNNLYSFIEQGRIGKIVHARPEERRSLIDEAAGISRYKVRREEARERLVATAAQLDRAADVAEEMGRRERQLARQVLKAAQYRHLRARIRLDEIALAIAKDHALTQERRALRARLRTVEGELETVSRRKARRETDLAERRGVLAVLEGAVDTGRDKVADLDGRLRELDGLRAFSVRRIEESSERARRHEELRQAAANDAARAESERDNAASLVDSAGLALVEASAAREAAVERARVAGVTLDAAKSVAKEQRARAQRSAMDAERISLEYADLERRAEAVPARLLAAEQEAQRTRQEAESAVVARDAAVDRHLRARADLDEADLARSESNAAEAEAKASEQRAAVRLADAEAELARRRAAERARILELERAASEADEAADRARAQADAEVERRWSSARAGVEEAFAKSRAGREADLRAGRARVSTWVEAWDRVEAEKVARLDERLRREAAVADRARTEHAAREDAEVRRRLAESESDARRLYQEGSAEIDRQASEIAAREASARQALGEARELARGTGRRLAEVRADLARLEAASRGANAADRGASAVRAALPEASALVEALAADVRNDPAIAVLLGERLTLPRVRSVTEVLEAAAAARKSGRSSIMWRPGEHLDRAGALGSVQVVPDLAAGLALFQQSPGSFVVLGTGERIDADGRVWVGPVDDAGRVVLDLVERREKAKVAVAEAEAEDATARERLASAEQAFTTAEEALTRSRRDRTESLGALQRRQEDALRAAREEASAALASTASHLASARDAQTAEARARVLEARAAVDLARAELIARRDLVLSRLDDTFRTSLDHDRARGDERLRLLRDEIRSAVEEELSRLEVRRQERRKVLAESRGTGEDPAWTLEVETRRLALREARTEVEVARAAAGEASERRSRAELFAARAEATAAAAQDAVRRSEAAASSARAQLAAGYSEGNDLASRLQIAGIRRDELRVSASEAERAAAEAEQRLVAAEAEATASREVLESARLTAATWDERVRSAKQEFQRAERACVDAARREGEAAASVLEAVGVREEAARTLEEANQGRERAVVERAEAWDRLERDRARLSVLRDEFRAGEQEHRDLAESEVRLGRERDQLSGQVDAARAEVEVLRQRIEERYQLSVPGLLDQIEAAGRIRLEVDPSVSQPFRIEGTEIPGVDPEWVDLPSLLDEDRISARVQRLAESRKELDRLGDVNLAAFDEYAEIHARHADLEAQRADLEASVESIRSAIASLNKTCRQRFRDTFDLVNQNFQEMYPRLVGGGAGRLALTDEEDLLEAGVEIYVQPPGKRLQNLSLLSGGEKAMTAIALILSLFKVKPSPFCVLDEVDAPLDEANGSRFNEALKEMSAFSQFIVVTHNRKTMECAATLYGITMPDPGVSSLVSVQLGQGGTAG